MQVHVWFSCVWQIKLCDLLVTHGPHLGALAMIHYKAVFSFVFATIDMVNKALYIKCYSLQIRTRFLIIIFFSRPDRTNRNRTLVFRL